MTETNAPAHTSQIAKAVPQNSVFTDRGAYSMALGMAKEMAASSIIPKDYQGNQSNCMIALEMANRMHVSPLMVMQNLDIIHGRPAFNSKFTVALVNNCGRYSQLRYTFSGEGETRQCVAHATERATGDRLEGTPVTIAMARAEGWFTRAGSKWPTMPDQMLMYRAGKFWQNMYEPGLTMGMPTSDEVDDFTQYDAEVKAPDAIGKLNETVVHEAVVMPEKTPANTGEAAKLKVRPQPVSKAGDVPNDQII